MSAATKAAQSETYLEAAREGLFEPAPGLYIAPVRHHSPACAWAVRQLIAEVRPQTILVEGPADFTDHISLLLDEETRPPVAIAALVDRPAEEDGPTGGRVAAYYPFCEHSPEYEALRAGRDLGADLSFIDLSSVEMAQLRAPKLDESSALTPLALLDDAHFGAGAVSQEMAKRLGCRDGFELWDHLFETRLGETDWRAFFADVGAYCAALRAATPADVVEAEGDAVREARMGAAMLKAHKAAKGAPVLVVVGGFHAPALIEIAKSGAAAEVKLQKTKGVGSRSYLVRYGFKALDALNGYGAGLPQPGYYDELWRKAEAANGPPPWREMALEMIADFARGMRESGYEASAPILTEAVRMAETLALMRGRPGPLRHDAIDGLISAFAKGEGEDFWAQSFQDFLRGEKLGDIPASAGSPPLVEDARIRAKANRIDVSDGARRRRKLDIRRKPAHLAASRFLHQMEMMDAGFASFEGGPDYLNNSQTDLLFEEWSYAWSPRVEGRLIELAALGDQAPIVCARLLLQQRDALRADGQARDIRSLINLLSKGLLAGLGSRLQPLLSALAEDLGHYGDFTSLADALRKLHHLTFSAGPLGAPDDLDLQGARDAAYQRLLYLCGDLPNTPPENMGDQLQALRLVTDLLRGPGGDAFDREAFDAAIDLVAMADPPPEILGGALAICTAGGRRSSEDLVAALSGGFNGAPLAQEARIGALRGMLAISPELLWRADNVLQTVDAFLQGLEEEEFLLLLPHLRLALAGLNPRETDRVAEMLGLIHGHSAGAYTASSAETEEDLMRGAQIERQLRASIKADGLADWLEGAQND